MWAPFLVVRPSRPRHRKAYPQTFDKPISPTSTTNVPATLRIVNRRPDEERPWSDSPAPGMRYTHINMYVCVLIFISTSFISFFLILLIILYPHLVNNMWTSDYRPRPYVQYNSSAPTRAASYQHNALVQQIWITNYIKFTIKE